MFQPYVKERKINIFYFDPDPKECAHQHCDKHCIKMIVEYAQLLSTAHRVLDGVESIQKSLSGRNQKVWTLSFQPHEQILYKATHINHPSAKWVRANHENYAWLANLFLFLLQEYTSRYGKVHKCEAMFESLAYAPFNISTGIFTPPWRAMPEEFKVDKSGNDKYCEQSYHAYLITQNDILPNGNTMTFLHGLFQRKKPDPKEQHAISEIEHLEKRIQLLTLIINDYHSNPVKYCQVINGPIPEAINQLMVDRTKLEIQHLYLTKFF